MGDGDGAEGARMSRDGYLPDNVRESDLPGGGKGHHRWCPCNEINIEEDDTEDAGYEPCCTCADLADDDKESAADARAASREEGWERP